MSGLRKITVELDEWDLSIIDGALCQAIIEARKVSEGPYGDEAVAHADLILVGLEGAREAIEMAWHRLLAEG